MKRFLSQHRFVWLAMLLLIAPLLTRPGAAGAVRSGDEVFIIKTVILVRHAERLDTSADSPLSAAGFARAQKLAEMFAPAGIKAIYITQYLRTKQTAEPLSKQTGVPLTPITIQVKQSNPREVSEESIRQIVDRIMGGTDGTVLVVGHSNSVPDVIKMLGAGEAPFIDEKKFDDLFIVTVFAKGQAKVMRMKY
jgi:phosphohistidine phosphatase SixA